ncbi:hypothetical protein AWJ14_20835 [Hoeflea olei]|uniref:HTH luxR-type domain-containing protein n=2 Tax=Hoeflea olei TaxID=1480615 RepID=A0A1C1YZD4_9HYPH|nr:hypothetical protein AWJ14_20835 [Hoeflea olei]
MDFFRLFKALALGQGFQHFVLFEVGGEDEGINLRNPHVLHNLPDSLIDAAGGRPLGAGDELLAACKPSTAAYGVAPGAGASRILDAIGAATMIAVPLHTVAARRYCLMMLGDRGLPEHETLAVVALDAALIFQRYHDAILSLDSISGLNDREIQIVRWTSEGKTSAEIAIILGLSEHTVNSYIATVLRKLHVVNRAQMVASALRSGLIA